MRGGKTDPRRMTCRERRFESIVFWAVIKGSGKWCRLPERYAFYWKDSDPMIVGVRSEFVTVMKGGASNVRHQRAIGRIRG